MLCRAISAWVRRKRSAYGAEVASECWRWVAREDMRLFSSMRRSSWRNPILAHPQRGAGRHAPGESNFLNFLNFPGVRNARKFVRRRRSGPDPTIRRDSFLAEPHTGGGGRRPDDHDKATSWLLAQRARTRAWRLR